MIKYNLQFAVEGTAIGKAYIVKTNIFTPLEVAISEEEIQDEMDKYQMAVEKSISELELLEHESDIFAAQKVLLRDETLHQKVYERIHSKMNAEKALSQTIQELNDIFISLEEVFLSERFADIQDIGNRVMSHMKGIKEKKELAFAEATILFAKDLLPSDVSNLKHSNVVGIVLEAGGRNSHVSIIARSHKIPVIINAKELLDDIYQGQQIMIDGIQRLLISNPTVDQVAETMRLKDMYSGSMCQIKSMPIASAITKDGREISLLANVGTVDDIQQARNYGIMGIGLLRSEFLYMDNTTFPSEDEQLLLYREAVNITGGVVVIRTLDIGGDKQLPYFTLGSSGTSVLHDRGIRVTLNNKEMFCTQLRAILRASAFGEVKILLPMVTSVEEIHETKNLIEACKRDLINRNISFDHNIAVGIMVETPAAVCNIDILIDEVEFVSIGSNDLTQYLLLTDRCNAANDDRYSHYHPAVIRCIKHIIDIAHKHHKKVTICGEMAAVPKATPLLIGLGLESFSMTPNSMYDIKRVIERIDYDKMKILADHVLKCRTTDQVMKQIDEWING